MLKTVTKDQGSKIVVVLFLVLSVWWIILQFVGGDLARQVFGASYGLLALFGGLYGIHIASKWGGLKSVFGKSIMMFSFGLLAQEFGQITYSVYTFFLNVEIPYPSWGDLGYFGSIPLYILAVYFLAKTSGVKTSLLRVKNWFWSLLVPLFLLAASYNFFLQGYDFSQSPTLVVFLDFGYPFGQAIYVSIAILAYLLSRNVLGGIMRKRILFVLSALLVQFFADYMFLYLVRYSSVSPAGINDYIYLVSYFLLSLSLTQLKSVSDTLSGNSQ